MRQRTLVIILRKPLPGLSTTALAGFVFRAGRVAKLRGAVDVLVTTSRELQRLNQRFRGTNQATDVLSFPPAAALSHGAGRHFAGEIAISADIARSNARQLGHSAATEIKILTLHGLLHLAGYDHEHDHGQMARKEAKLRKTLRLPVGLIERSGAPPQPSARKTVPKKAARATRARQGRP